MINNRLILMALILVLIAVPLNISYSQELQSISGQQDINALMAAAQKTFDIKNQDAVLLFNGKRYNMMPDGRLVEYTHQIIWIGTDYGIEHYGDRRIPYDSGHCSFKTVTVRTWRDNQWWETGETGKVETLPSQLRNAYDYSDMREMMLLHNGIEIPCILEVAYIIEDKAPFRKGFEGIWSFQREEPAVASWFGLGLPIGAKPRIEKSSDVPDYEVESNEKNGLNVYWWKMGPLPAIPPPRNDDYYAEVPHISWSTWPDWKAYGDYIAGHFVANAAIDSSLKARLDSTIADARNSSEKVSRIAEFIETNNHYIDYPEYFWNTGPRSAMRTYNTAYAHRLDRAILAAAMFSKEGFNAYPIYVSDGYGDLTSELPSLGRFAGIALVISDRTYNSIYYPSDGRVVLGNLPFANRTIWLPGLDIQPRYIKADSTLLSDFSLLIDLEYASKDTSFKGTGYLYTANMFSIFRDVAGIDNETKTYLGRMIGGLLPGAKITGYNLALLNENEVGLGFSFEFKKPDPDDFDRLKLTIGEPSGALISLLPQNVRLYNKDRESTINLPDKLKQKIEIRLNLDGLDLVYSPEDIGLINDCGSFKLISDKQADKLILTKEIELAKTKYISANWPSFKALLLNETGEKNRTVLLKTGGKAK